MKNVLLYILRAQTLKIYLIYIIDFFIYSFLCSYICIKNGQRMINLKRIIGTSAFGNGLFKRNRFFISVFWIIGIGILIGAVAVGMFYNSEKSIINDICLGYFEKRASQSIFSCFLATFSSALTVIILTYLFGLCAMGVPMLYSILAFDSIGKGLILGFVYIEYGFLGILKSLVFLLPQNVMLCLLIFYAVSFSVKMSKQIYNMLSDYNGSDYQINKKLYNKRYLLFVLGILVLSVVDALMSRFTAVIIK